MQVILPIIVDDSSLTRTNVPEDDATEYNPATTYNIGDRAMLAASNKWYEALENGITGVSPDSDPVKWLDLGATRPWRMFDNIIGSTTTANSNIPDSAETGISIDVTPTTRISAVSLFGLDASYVDVQLISKIENASDLSSYPTQTEFEVDWTIGAGISYDNIDDEIDYSTSNSSAYETDGVFPVYGVDTYFLISVDVTVTSGSIKIQTNTGSFVDNLTITSTGTYNVSINVSDLISGELRFTGVSFTGSIGAISVKQMLYNSTFFVGDDLSIPDWYQWYFEGINRRGTLLVNDISISSIGDTLRINIRKGNADATVGEIVIGEGIDLGVSITGTDIGIRDYSRKETDAFGNFIITPRQYSDIMSVDFIIDNRNLSYVKKILTSLRTTPAVWAAAQSLETTIIFGYYRSFDIIISGENSSDAAIDIEGLI